MNSQKKILILEDDGKRITTFIEFLGQHKLVITEDPDEAIKYLVKHKFDLVFLNNKGLKVVIFIRKYIKQELNVVVHTLDFIEAEYMRDILPYIKILEYNTEEFYLIGEVLW